MKDKRGSITVIALVFLLFLAIIGGSWLIMMTQEKTNAMADQNQQQAWYAAEAGYKRALTQIKAKNTDWGWLTSSSNYSSKKYTFWGLQNLQSRTGMDSTTAKGTPLYAVYIAEIPAPDASVTISEGAKYNITAIGDFMGERKVIQRSYTTSSTSGGGGSQDSDLSKLQANSLVVAKGAVTIKGAGNSSSSGDVYSNANLNSSSNKSIVKKDSYDNAATSGTMLSLKMPDSVFDESKYASGVKYTAEQLNQSSAFDPTGAYSITGKAGQFVFVTDSGTLTKAIAGPTDTLDPSTGNVTQAEPFTVIVNGDLTISEKISGNVRILVKGKLTVTTATAAAGVFAYDATKNNRGVLTTPAYIMLAANGGMDIGRSIGYGLLVSAGDINYEPDSTPLRYAFRGQILSEGQVSMHLGYIYYAGDVATHVGFGLPTGAVTGG